MRAERRLATNFRGFKLMAKHRKVARCRSWGNHRAHSRVEGDQPDCVALTDHQVSQRGGDSPGMLELGDRLPGVPHAARRIDDKERLQVRLFLIFLDVIPVGLAERPPVDMPDLVAGPVLAMLGKLDRETLERAPVQTGRHAFDHQASQQLEPAETGECAGVERFFGLGHCGCES